MTDNSTETKTDTEESTTSLTWKLIGAIAVILIAHFVFHHIPGGIVVVAIVLMCMLYGAKNKHNADARAKAENEGDNKVTDESESLGEMDCG